MIERNRADDTFGWGVVFSDETLRNLKGGDPQTEQRISDSFAHWDDIDIHFKGRVIRSGGHGFCGIERRRLLNILQERAAELGVELIFKREVHDVAEFADADLIVAADGVNSAIRTRYADHFRAVHRRAHQPIRLARHAQAVRGLHVHLRRDRMGLVPGPRLSLQRRYLDIHRRDDATRPGARRASIKWTWPSRSRFCERLFAPWLDGNALLTNMRHLRGSQFINFHRVSNETWSKDRIVLMGDAAHTAHFSIGSGTKLALEDAIGLAQCIDRSRRRHRQPRSPPMNRNGASRC